LRLKQITTFYWAAKLGSFVKAAHHLNATQSAVSVRIQQLESRLGTTLFHRAQGAARLTSEGELLLPLAEEVIAATERLLNAARHKEPVEGYVKLGVAEVVALTWLPEFLDALRVQYPLVQPDVEVGLSYVLEQKVDAGEIDLAVLPCQLSASRFAHSSLGRVPFRWMCAASRTDIPHTVSAAEFMDLPIIATSRELQLRSSALTWIRDNQIVFRAPTICNTFTIVAKMAAAGLGVALLPVSLYREAIEQGELRMVNCVPEMQPFEMFVIRPLSSIRPVDLAVEALAVEIGRPYTARTAGETPRPIENREVGT